MKVWLVTVGEPLPIDGEAPRIMRTGLLAAELVGHGHEVVWWSARFDHTSKVHRGGERSVALAANYELRLLDSPGYASNISIRRWADHLHLAVRFLGAARGADRPDCVVASLPPTELALAATLLRGSIRIVDVRDKWPDVLLERDDRPGLLARLGAAVIGLSARAALRRADVVWAHAPAFLEWAQQMGRRRHVADDAVFVHGYADGSTSEEHEASAAAFWGSRVADGASPTRFVFSGALSEQFNFEAIIAALDLLQARGRRAEVVFCGIGEQEARLRSLAAGRTDVVVAGFVDRPTLWHIIDRSIAGLAPYVSSPAFEDSMPNKIIEYFARAKPVISSLGGQSREIIEERGLGSFYRAGDVDELAFQMEKFLDDPSGAAEAGRRARAVFEAEYSALKVYPAMVVQLEQLTTAKVGRR